MTTTELRTEAIARGFTHVRTYGGPLPLEQWDPYGRFTTNRPTGRTLEAWDARGGYDPEIRTWAWVDATHVVDGPTPAPPLCAGQWEFLTL